MKINGVNLDELIKTARNLLFNYMTPEQRLEFLGEITKGICIKCGNEKNKCTCEMWMYNHDI